MPSLTADQQNATATLDPTAGVARNGDQKIEAIRDILLGDYAEGLTHRFNNLEKSMEAHQSTINDEIMTRFDTLQALTKSRVDELGESVVEMVSQLQEEDHALAEELRNSSQRLAEFEKRVDDMTKALTEHVRKMHEQFSEQLTEFSLLIKNQQDEAARQSVSRKDFAQILNGLAGSLAQQEAGPVQQEAGPPQRRPAPSGPELTEVTPVEQAV